ncbi:hypothetical protein [Methanobacterium congolense]|uniref:Region of a membrane-bound protein predicted to be embedded in the membrane n=1 Tax=Methanobacterium congolense TaxID=118062 RepID=A0A1D3L3B0_9EURY|nr:hypothetical protein [Methanobacterium congolense]SCG85950.1 Region of a membrane-bound protein predicted to be embedded in the membrane [Methanobacterium congolense]
MKKIWSILVLFLILAIVGVSGCIGTNSVQNKTFSSSGISFQYPGNWSDNVTVNWTSGNAQNETIGNLGNGNVTLGVLYINASSQPLFASYDIPSLGNLAVLSWKSDGTNTTVLSNTNRQIGNNTVDEIIYTSPNPVSGAVYKYYYVITGEQGKSIYILRFGAPEADFANYYSQFQGIVNSINITK